MQVGNKQNECYHFLYTGNCLNQHECKKLHPDILKVKKKLKFNKKQEFIPDEKFVSKIIEKTPTVNPVCGCCGGRPYGCRRTQSCIEIGQCCCTSVDLMEETMKEQEMNRNTGCECCHNDQYNCKNLMCRQLGMCQCLMREVMEGNVIVNDPDDAPFAQEYADCSCCKGFIYSCENADCQMLTHCFCLL